VFFRKGLRELENGLTGGYAAVPADLVSGGAAAEAYRWAQSYVARFGKLLECWPDIVSAAGQLNAAGHGVCRTLNRPRVSIAGEPGGAARMAARLGGGAAGALRRAAGAA